MTIMGGGILFFGWFGFNGSCALGANFLPQAVILNTLLAGSAALLAAFCLVERRSASPMVDVSILTEPTYAGSVLVGFIIQAALIGPMAFLSLYAQTVPARRRTHPPARNAPGRKKMSPNA